MFVVNDDMSIYLTRGDTAIFSVTADNNGKNYVFQPGDVVRMKVTEKKACENVMFQKDFPVTEEAEKVDILLTEEETKIGEVISKPTDYWYEIELNPYTNPQTIVGYDEDGAKILRLFPEGIDLEPTPIEPTDIPVVDNELSLTSDRPVQNQAISRAITGLGADIKYVRDSGSERMATIEGKIAAEASRRSEDVLRLSEDIAVERARISTLVANAGNTDGNAELLDIRVGADGTTYATAGEAVRGQVGDLKSDLYDLTSGSIVIDGYTFYQRSDNRIWYTNDDFGLFKVGDYVSANNSDYDVAWFYHDSVGWFNSEWNKGSFATETYKQGVAIRKADKSDISALTPSELKAILTVTRETTVTKRINELESKITANKFYHVSFDDCVFWSDLIANESVYTSCFQNAFLSNIKTLHEKTGVCVTLNCFCTDTGNNRVISDVPSKFANEFKVNSDWLKFGFHAEDENSNYSTDQTASIKVSYDKFVNAIFKMTGTIDCIDRVTRLTFYTGTLNNIKAIRDTNCGIVGLLYRDEDTGLAYYLNDEQCAFINNHGKWFDSDNNIMFLKTNTRLEAHDGDYQTDMVKFSTVEYGNKSRYVEIFTHEYAYYDSGSITRVANLEKYCEWAKNNGYCFGFAQDFLKL